jgi:hypothetical protein
MVPKQTLLRLKSLLVNHTRKKLGKNNFFYLVKKVHFSGIENFISQRCKIIATNGKWNEHKFDMKKFQSLDVGALVLLRAFGLTEISQLFCYKNWQILMNESAFHFCGRWFLQPLFFTSQSLHPRVVFLTFSVCVFWMHSIFSKVEITITLF